MCTSSQIVVMPMLLKRFLYRIEISISFIARRVSDTTIVGYGVGRCWKSKRKNPGLSSNQMRMTDTGNVRCVAFTLNMCAYSSGNSRRIRSLRVRLFRQTKCISNSLDGVEENTMDAFAPIHTNTKRKNRREIAFGICYSVGYGKNLTRKVSDTRTHLPPVECLTPKRRG